MITRITYVAALRFLLFGERPSVATFLRSSSAAMGVGLTVYAYVPDPETDVRPGIPPLALTVPTLQWGMERRQDLVAATTLYEALAPSIARLYPPDRSLIVGAKIPDVDGASYPRPIDPILRMRDAGETYEIAPGADGRDELVARPQGKTLAPADVFMLLRDWIEHSARRVRGLRDIWAADLREDGPHQPWARERARFLTSLGHVGVLPPALSLLPQWQAQWWYDAAGYEQARPTSPPRPARCWRFPAPDGTPAVCGRALPCPIHQVRLHADVDHRQESAPPANRERLLALLLDVRTLLDGTGRDDITERIDLVLRDEHEGAG